MKLKYSDKPIYLDIPLTDFDIERMKKGENVEVLQLSCSTVIKHKLSDVALRIVYVKESDFPSS